MNLYLKQEDQNSSISLGHPALCHTFKGFEADIYATYLRNSWHKLNWHISTFN